MSLEDIQDKFLKRVNIRSKKTKNSIFRKYKIIKTDKSINDFNQLGYDKRTSKQMKKYKTGSKRINLDDIEQDLE